MNLLVAWINVQKIVTFQPKLSVVRKKQVSDYLFAPLIFSRHADATTKQNHSHLLSFKNYSRV